MATPGKPSFVRREGTFEREPARRVFAAELRETRIHFREGDDEKSPTYVLLPTGERCNRVFLVGTLTEKKKQGEQNMFYRARVVDPTGTFFIMAGSYQPEAMQQIARIEAPAFVAVTGKPNVYETPDGATPYLGPLRIDHCRRQGHAGPLGARLRPCHARQDRPDGVDPVRGAGAEGVRYRPCSVPEDGG